MITSIVVLGEKDHGKSTLIGRLIFETRSMPEDRLREVRSAIKKSGQHFLWAHLLDSFRYERKREMTLDTTRANIKLGKEFYEFIDVPGHKELIKNMITGASDARFAILVIDAEEGARPQTLKHLEIAKFLGIEKIVVVVNKMDRINYSQLKFENIEKPFKSAIPTAALNGANLIRKSDKLKWFRGPTLGKAIIKNFGIENYPTHKSGRAKIAKNFGTACLFIERPRKNLRLESRSNICKISKLGEIKRINSIENIQIRLAKPAPVSEKFVIKTGGRIIGICKMPQT